MRVVLEQLPLAKALQVVSRVVSAQNTLPVLSGVLVHAEGTSVALTATDLVSQITTQIAADVQEEGALVLPAATLTDLVQRIPTAELRIEADTLRGQAVVHFGRNRVTLHGYLATELPAFPVLDASSEPVPLPAGTLTRMARQTLFACAKDESRPILKGVHTVLGEGKMVCVSTDGTRLSQSWVPLPDLRSEPANFVIGGRSFQEAARIAGTDAVTMQYSGTMVRFTTPTATLTTLLLEGRYPEYQRVLPDQYVTEMRMATSILRGAVERANLIAHHDRGSSIHLKYDAGQLEVTTQASEVGQVYEVLDVDSQGQSLELSFSPALLWDAVRSIESEEIILEFSGAQMPARIREATNSLYSHIVLPLRQLV